MSQAGRYISNSGPGGFIQTLTGDTGGPVPPTGGNIDIFGGHDIFTVGDPATSTITINVDNAITLGDLSVIAPGSDALTAVTGNISIIDGNLNLPDTNLLSSIGTIRFAGGRFIHDYGSAGLASQNTYIGLDSGSATSTGSNNSGIGASSLEVLGSGSNNFAGGVESLNLLGGGNFNTAVGNLSLLGLASGSNNCAFGYNSGSAYVISESSNVVISNVGTAGESNVIRIGTQGSGAGQQNECFIAGITGVNVGSVASVVSIASVTGHLGLTTITAGTGVTVTPGANTITISASGTSTLTYTNVTTTPYVVLSTDEYLSVDSSALAITVNLPNAPATGRSYIIKDRTGSASVRNITVTTVGGAVNIDGATTFVMNTNLESIQVLFNGVSYEIY